MTFFQFFCLTFMFIPTDNKFCLGSFYLLDFKCVTLTNQLRPFYQINASKTNVKHTENNKKNHRHQSRDIRVYRRKYTCVTRFLQWICFGFFFLTNELMEALELMINRIHQYISYWVHLDNFLFNISEALWGIMRFNS